VLIESRYVHTIGIWRDPIRPPSNEYWEPKRTNGIRCGYSDYNAQREWRTRRYDSSLVPEKSRGTRRDTIGPTRTTRSERACTTPEHTRLHGRRKTITACASHSSELFVWKLFPLNPVWNSRTTGPCSDRNLTRDATFGRHTKNVHF